MLKSKISSQNGQNNLTKGIEEVELTDGQRVFKQKTLEEFSDSEVKSILSDRYYDFKRNPSAANWQRMEAAMLEHQQRQK